MSQEDKELLLKDLCARLPYNVKCKVHLDTKGYCLRDEDKYCDDTLESINYRKQTCTFNKSIGYNLGNFVIEEVKPYLRPMSSMTEEEEVLFRCELPAIAKTDVQLVAMRMELFLKGHLDFNHLIEKGLALQAPEGMYDTSQKWTTIRSELKENENGQIVGGLKL